jgi:hypothetical protein
MANANDSCHLISTSAAISSCQQWHDSPVAFGKRKVRYDSSRLPTTPRAPPSMIGAWEEQHIQPIRIKEKAKTDSDWSESFGQRQVKIVSLLMSTLAIFQRKCEMERV